MANLRKSRTVFGISLACGKWGDKKTLSDDGEITKSLSALRLSFIDKLGAERQPTITAMGNGTKVFQFRWSKTPKWTHRLSKEAMMVFDGKSLLAGV